MIDSTAPTVYRGLNNDKFFETGPANSTTLTKMHFIDILNERLGLSRTEASSVLDAMFEEMQTALVDGREVKLANFGTFHTRSKGERPGRNPRTGEEHMVSARRVVAFIPAPYLRESVATFHDPSAEAGDER